MAEHFYKIEDEPFPSFLGKSLDSTVNRTTIGNVTLGSGPGLPVAASTVAKIRPDLDNRVDHVESSYLEAEKQFPDPNLSVEEKPNFTLGFKDGMDQSGEFMAVRRLSDLLVKINLDESSLPPSNMDQSHDMGLRTGISKEKMRSTPSPENNEDVRSDGANSDQFTGSNSSFLANEKLMTVDSINSDVTDDDIDLNNLPDEELELYFKKLMPPVMQRGQVEGQEIPGAHDFQMPDVRVAATGMDSCPASDEDTGDELDFGRRISGSTEARLLPSTTRQLVGESNRPSFRPGLEGGSSDDESSSAVSGPYPSAIEHRRSAEGRVINPPVAGDGGGGDGSSGSEDSGNAAGVPTPSVPAPYDALRGMGLVGSSDVVEEEDVALNMLTDLERMGDRVGPVGTGASPGEARRLSGALDSLESTQSASKFEGILDSIYLKSGTGLGTQPDLSNLCAEHLQGNQESLRLSQVSPSFGPREGPFGDTIHADASDTNSDGDNNPLSTSLEAKYFTQSFQGEQEDSDDVWNNCSNNMDLEFQQGAAATNSVVYQNEEGQWVTDLAYYSSFQKEVDGKTPEIDDKFETEDFVSASTALEKLAKDQVEFEKEHQFMQEEQIVPASGNSTFQSDSSWKAPGSSHILMRASQVASEYNRNDQSYLRLSLGQFFEQRSEALGCLGITDDFNWIKRPSFGYVITSPEKREPFPLLRPANFSPREDDSPQSDAIDLSEADKTLNPEDLDQTLKSLGERQSPKGDVCDPDKKLSTTVVLSKEKDSSEPNHQSSASPQNDSHLMLSISSIASAIADASISTDPSHLANMILELSKKSRMRRLPKSTDATSSFTENSEATKESVNGSLEESATLDTLQQSTLGDLSTFDIEKYLKKSDVSDSSETSVGHTTFDLTRWADNVNQSTNFQAGYSEEQRNSCTVSHPKTQVGDDTEKASVSVAGPKLNASSARSKSQSKRSSIPRSTFNVSRLSVGTSSLEPSMKVKPLCSSKSPTHTEGELNQKASNKVGPFQESSLSKIPISSSGLPRTSGKRTKGESVILSPHSQKGSEMVKHQNEGSSKHHGMSGMVAPLPQKSLDKKNPDAPCQPAVDCAPELRFGLTGTSGEETQCNFRPSTSPLTHSSPSQTVPPTAVGAVSPMTPKCGAAGKRPVVDLSPESTCSSPSLSRLTYISLNDGTVVPTPDRQKSNCTMGLSTTIIRFSPTPPMEQEEQSNVDLQRFSKSLDQVPAQHCKSLDTLLPQNCKDSAPVGSASTLSCTRSQSECNHRMPGDRTGDPAMNCKVHDHVTEANPKMLTKVDSGYCSNLYIPQTSAATAPQTQQPWGPNATACVYSSGIVMQPPFPPDLSHYVPLSGFRPICPGLMDIPHQRDMQSLITGPSVFNSQLAQPYLHPEAPVPSGYHVNTGGLYNISSSDASTSDLTARKVHPISQPLGVLGHAGQHLLPGSNSSQQVERMEKLYSQYRSEPMMSGGVEELRGQVVVPEELQFPNSCCVGIASQTSLSIFNPTERWQQVSISVTSLAIDGEKVESFPYQWLIVKNRTIIGPKSTEEQKVLFIPPQPGVYHCVLNVCSWPASAETEVAARAKIFARRVVLIAIAENPSLDVEVSKLGLDFGDLPGGSAKILPLKIINRTHATVPIRLVISANATAWRCFMLSKQPVPLTSEGTQQAGHMTTVSSPSVMNHVMHASYGENPESFIVWVHFKAPQKYRPPSGEIGSADEYTARVDIEVDSPGASRVIQSIPIRARSGTAQVHAPKDLQTVRLSAPLGKSTRQTLPLKNAGNIDVQLKLKSSDAEGCFTVMPSELSLRVGEEQGIVVSFTAQGSRKCTESLLTILVMPSGPEYELNLKGEVVPENPGKTSGHSPTAPAPVVNEDVPSILSNRQFVTWGGVTLGQAVQQKLILRNNSSDVTQYLQLLIRGQDQDCFQLQSMFSSDEGLTRRGEVTIRPREDVTIHLLFAPTRVACMLARLEIKRSGARPSQSGTKFTIPLFGYGGTSNIILEDQRKQADGYVATLTDIALDHVSKVCLCVRNTGSRAAFVKAVAFSDVPTRLVVDPTVMSLAPSQFVLKERTQEVITVLVKSTQRELSLAQAGNALMATIVLFCGDEVSRQQYRRLLQNKPDAARKALSENSLQKNIDFNEKFLGDDNITETCNLPQRPNEAHVFFGNMRKVVVSLLGSVKTTEMEADTGTSTQSAWKTERNLDNGNVSLDVLPVKGPQGSAMTISESSVKGAQPLTKPTESWLIRPEQLLLPAPTPNGVACTSRVQIQNKTSKELSFDLSWPAHCLTVTPQHGVIDPQCHLQILVSPNPSLANKSSLLPWSGQIYVQCDGQQKVIKVQIRQDLALDVSAAPADTTLSALAPQPATPSLAANRLAAVSAVTPVTAPALLEISNRNILFPNTPSGDSSEAMLEVENGSVEVRWYLSSFAPAYVRGVDSSCDVYRATYTAFRCCRVSGTLGAKEKMKVPFTFLPRDRGDYAQFWDLECHPLSEPQQKTRIRFQLGGTGLESASVEGLQEVDCSLVKIEATVKSRKRTYGLPSKSSHAEAAPRGVYSPKDMYTFAPTRIGESSTIKVDIYNRSPSVHELKFVNPREPFHIKKFKCSVRSQHFVKLSVYFKPTTTGRHDGLLLVQPVGSDSIVVQLTGEALP
ncbi:centrosomal protein of 192 kDa [Neosynchiropus ocellatus]